MAIIITIIIIKIDFLIQVFIGFKILIKNYFSLDNSSTYYLGYNSSSFF
jgi:hypothetical protein